MEQLAPLGPVYQAGTLSANPVAMAAGLATLKSLDESAYQRLESLGERLEAALEESAALTLQRQGSMFWLCPAACRETIRKPDQIPHEGMQAYPPLFHAAAARGVYLPPSPLEVGFLATAHDEADIDQLAEILLAST